MSILLALEKIRSSSHIRELRMLYDKVVVNLRALSAFQIESKQFGPMLIPVILEKLPSEIKLEISRKMNGTEWDLENLIDILKLEIEARENCVVTSKNLYVENSKEMDKQAVKGFTTEQLFVGDRYRNAIESRNFKRCCFCKQ